MDTVLQTKLYIPQQPSNPTRGSIIPRLRLLDKLNGTLHCKFSLVSAPTGFGKTTLVATWLSGITAVTPTWLSLDKNDNDSVRFLTYFVHALRGADASLGESALLTLQSTRTPDFEVLLTAVLNEIAQLTQPIILVLDDFHVINEEKVHEIVQFVLQNQPPPLHLIITSRTEPPWPLARWRARGDMVELRGGDLRFTLEETTLFLNNVMGFDLPLPQIKELDERIEGWVAGLQMAALSIQGRDPKAIPEFIHSFTGSHHYILDYLTEEVMQRQPESVQNFLLLTSILDRLNGSLCDVVLEDDIHPSSLILHNLEQANLFIIPLDNERRWYRYHHLFADLLRSRLTAIHPELVPILHQRASEWYEAAGFSEETIFHAFKAEDYERIARLIEKYAWDMLHQSKHSLLFSWIESLPEALVKTRPWLCVYQSWTRHWAGMRESGEECLKNAEQLLDRLPDSGGKSKEEKRLITGYVATVRAHYALTNENIPRALEQAQKALRLLPEDDYFTRSTAGVALAGAYWGIGDSDSAERTSAECAANALRGGFPYRASSALCYMGMHQVKQARLQQAQETFHESLALATGPKGRYFPNAGYPLIKLGELTCEWNDLEQARRYVDEGVKLCRQLGHVDLMAEAFVALARVQLAGKDISGVKETLQEASQLLQKSKVDPWISCWLDDCRLRLWLATGRLDEVIHWTETCGMGTDDSFSYHHDLEQINLARALVAIGNQHPSKDYLNEALDLLARLLLAAETAVWTHEVIKILILQAFTLQAMGDGEGAMAALTRALTLAKPSGYVRSFVDEGERMVELLQQTAVSGHSVTYVGKLLATLAQEKENLTRSVTHSSLVEPFSQRELQVLRLLATPLSSVEIAEQLTIAPSTVRSHIKNIYRKLDVHKRVTAVQRAQELKLL
ncbi:MAG: helix-turn-helix transcriptional regulator [Chloroflexi bacterium]|nr:helix-turn-helix transcriptional regulator [Chloroflexota bacterium]